MKASQILTLVILTLLITGCTLPGIRLFGDEAPGLVLATGESSNVHFFTNDPSFETDIGLVGGSDYSMSITILSNWVDSYIEENENEEPLDERGFSNSLMPIEALGMTRRSRTHQWFELMLSQDQCPRDSLRGISDLRFDEANDSYRFTASCSGELTLHVNDALGFYGNNIGYANIELSRLN